MIFEIRLTTPSQAFLRYGRRTQRRAAYDYAVKRALNDKEKKAGCNIRQKATEKAFWQTGIQTYYITHPQMLRSRKEGIKRARNSKSHRNRLHLFSESQTFIC